MAQSNRNYHIRITHFVNPHVFYFKWKKDSEELDEELDEIEKKITNIAKAANIASKKTNADNIVVSKVVGFFVSDWNKWIRCVVKAKSTNGTIYLWAPDYGLPFTGKESQIIVIPLSFQGMTAKYKVHLGGLIDIIPAEQYFDISTGNVEMKISKSWSATASEKLNGVLENSLALEFKDIQTHYPMQKPHLFGRLMIQLDNGTCHNATKGLLNLQCGIISHDPWGDVLKKHDTFHQEIWRTKDGTPLSYVTTVKTIKRNTIAEEANDVARALDYHFEADQDPDGNLDDCLSRVEIDQLTLEDQRILDTSASRIGYGLKRSQNNRKWVDPNSRTAQNKNRIPNCPNVNNQQTTTINGSDSNTSRNSNEFVGRAKRNTNPVRRNDRNYNNNDNHCYLPDYRENNRCVQGFKFNGRPFPFPPDGWFRPMEVGYRVGYQNDNQGYPDLNGNNQQRQTRTPRPGKNYYDRSGKIESRKPVKKNSNTFGRLEKINENPSGGRANVKKQNRNDDKAVEDQNLNVEKSIEKKSEISDVPKDNITETTENINVSTNGTTTIESEQ